MTTPKERAHLLDLLNRTVDWPLVAVVDAIAEVIDARDKARAEEFRRLAAFAHECLCYRLDDLSRASYETRQKTWEQAAQRLEALLEEVE